MSLFRFRDKQEKKGLILGAICFVPVFLMIMTIASAKGILISLILLGITQFLWLESIRLCTNSLELENKQLKDKINELNQKSQF